MNRTTNIDMPIDATLDTLEDDLDDLLRRASDGDRRALGAIAIALGPALLREARDALGQLGARGDDVFCDFFNGVAAGAVTQGLASRLASAIAA